MYTMCMSVSQSVPVICTSSSIVGTSVRLHVCVPRFQVLVGPISMVELNQPGIGLVQQ